MRKLCFLLLLHTSLQLQCDKREITAHIRGEFNIFCKYEHNRFRFRKKYWCRGASRNSCDILCDTDGVAKTKHTNRMSIVDTGRGLLIVKVTNLQIEDSETYWIGIDKIYADIMTLVKVTVTQVPVSKPRLWPLTHLMDSTTCWGKPVTVRCGSTMGTDISYAWYQHIHHKSFLFLHSSDLSLHCDTIKEHSEYYCSASNSISNEQSEMLSVQVLLPPNSSCIYVANIPGHPTYDCADRLRTTTAETSPPTTKMPPDMSEQGLQVNQTTVQESFSRTWTGVPLWFELLRWCALTVLLIALITFISCTKTRRRKCGRRRKR